MKMKKVLKTDQYQPGFINPLSNNDI